MEGDMGDEEFEEAEDGGEDVAIAESRHVSVRSKINYGKAEIVERKASDDSLGFAGDVRIIKFNGRFYTVFGTLFAVAGKNVPYEKACDMPEYQFTNWNTLENMFLSSSHRVRSARIEGVSEEQYDEIVDYYEDGYSYNELVKKFPDVPVAKILTDWQKISADFDAKVGPMMRGMINYGTKAEDYDENFRYKGSAKSSRRVRSSSGEVDTKWFRDYWLNYMEHYVYDKQEDDEEEFERELAERGVSTPEELAKSYLEEIEDPVQQYIEEYGQEAFDEVVRNGYPSEMQWSSRRVRSGNGFTEDYLEGLHDEFMNGEMSASDTRKKLYTLMDTHKSYGDDPKKMAKELFDDWVKEKYPKKNMASRRVRSGAGIQSLTQEEVDYMNSLGTEKGPEAIQKMLGKWDDSEEAEAERRSMGITKRPRTLPLRKTPSRRGL